MFVSMPCPILLHLNAHLGTYIITHIKPYSLTMFYKILLHIVMRNIPLTQIWLWVKKCAKKSNILINLNIHFSKTLIANLCSSSSMQAKGWKNLRTLPSPRPSAIEHSASELEQRTRRRYRLHPRGMSRSRSAVEEGG